MKQTIKAIPVLKEPVVEDPDEDYKPILSRYINTHCNYDGSKIESTG